MTLFATQCRFMAVGAYEDAGQDNLHVAGVDQLSCFVHDIADGGASEVRVLRERHRRRLARRADRGRRHGPLLPGERVVVIDG